MNRVIPLLFALLCACGATSRDTRAAGPSSYVPTAEHVDRGLITPEQAAEVDRLILGLFNENEHTRALSARRLGRMGAVARPALPYLIDCVVTDDTAAARECAVAASRVGADGPARLRELACGPHSTAASMALAALDDEPVACDARG